MQPSPQKDSSSHPWGKINLRIHGNSRIPGRDLAPNSTDAR
jgi:hypothetical protein